MKAGVDIGNSLTKVAWGLDDGKYQFASTADWDPDVLVKTLREEDGVTDVFLTGNGKPRIDWKGEGFNVSRIEGSRLNAEFVLQANGVRRLLELEDVPGDYFLLASIGTGTSYSFVRGSDVRNFPLGTAVGGGFIMGEADPCHTPEDVNDLSLKGKEKIMDLLLEDIPPVPQGVPGWLIISHFGKMRDHLKKHDYARDYEAEYATRMNMVAALILRDISLVCMAQGDEAPRQAVIIGSAPSRFELLSDRIDDYTQKMFPYGLIPPTLILENGEFAGAIGAYHAIAG